MDPKKADQASSLFRRFRDRGDPGALTELFELVSGELLALASYLAADAAQAEDFVQETFLTAIAKARRWDPNRPVLPWLIGILVRIARKERRRLRRTPDRERVSRPTTQEGSQVALEGELRVAVEAALAEMPARYADVLRPHLETGRPPREIAAQLGRTPGSVRVQLHRGLERLRKLLPPGLALGVGSWVGTRGMDAIRLEVQRAAIARGPALAAIGSGSLTFSTLTAAGATFMSLKSILGVLCLIVAGLGAFVGLNQREEATPLSLSPAEVFESDVEGGEVIAARTKPEFVPEVTPNREAAVIESDSEVDAAATEQEQRIVLVGTIEGLIAAPVSPLTISVRLGNPSKSSTSIQVAGNGSFEVDLGALTDEEIPLIQGVLVVAEGEGVIGDAIWAARDQSLPRSEGVRYTAKLQVKVISRLLSGRVSSPDGQAIPYTWIAFRAESTEAGVPGEPIFTSFPETYTERDGSFELELDSSSSGTLIVSHGDYQPRHIEIGPQPEASAVEAAVASASDEPSGPDDLGDIELSLGALITGHAYWGGRGAEAGTRVIASAPEGELTWSHAAHRLQIVSGRSVHRHVTAICDSEGRFELLGLEPGIEYRLVVAPETIDGHPYEYNPIGVHGSSVVAPADSVQIDGGVAAITLLVSSADELVIGDAEAANPVITKKGVPIKRAEARERLPEGDPLSPFPALYHTKKNYRPTSASDGKLRLLLATGAEAHLSVSAPGFFELQLTLSPDQIISGAEIPVKLQPVAKPTTLTVHIEYEGSGSLDGCLALLRMHGPKGLKGSDYVPILDGQAKFESMPLGVFSAGVYFYIPESLSLQELPYFPNAQIQIGTLLVTGAGDLEKRCVIAAGGRIELHLMGRDSELEPPQFELIAPSGQVVRPSMLSHHGEGHQRIEEINIDGPIVMGRSLPEGEWTLRQVGANYAQEEQQVNVRAGETTRLTVQLYPR